MEPRAVGQLKPLTIDDVGVFAVAAGLTVSAKGNDVESVPRALAGAAIFKRSAPGILDAIGIFDIGAIPAGHAAWRRIQALQSLFGGGIAADVQAIEIENSRKTLHRLLGDFMLGRTKLANDRRRNEADEQAENRKHDKKLDQREARFAAALPRLHFGTSAPDELSHRCSERAQEEMSLKFARLL